MNLSFLKTNIITFYHDYFLKKLSYAGYIVIRTSEFFISFFVSVSFFNFYYLSPSSFTLSKVSFF